MNVEEVSAAVVDAAFHLHRDLGPGLLESVYEVVLARMLDKRGLKVERQKPVEFDFDGMPRRFDGGRLPRRGIEVRGVPGTGPPKTVTHVPPPFESPVGTIDQLWCPDLQGRRETDREQPSRLHVFAASREHRCHARGNLITRRREGAKTRRKTWQTSLASFFTSFFASSRLRVRLLRNRLIHPQRHLRHRAEHVACCADLAGF